MVQNYIMIFISHDIRFLHLERWVLVVFILYVSCFLLCALISNIKVLMLFRFGTTLITFLMTLMLLFAHNFWLQIVDLEETYQGPFSFFFFDQLSLAFIVMSIFIITLCYIYIFRFLSLAVKPALLLVSFTEILVLLCFTVRNLLSFYIFFELILFPMTVLILMYGSRGRRVFASLSFFVYTFIGSIFILMGLFLTYSLFNTLQFDFFLNIDPVETNNKNNITLLLIFICFWIGFSVKLPTMPLHLWLPEAHVEAPTVGSVILAAILLKLGGFGILRVLVTITPAISYSVRIIPILFCIISVFYASVLAFRHFDLKKIIAYSSIVHMNFAALAFLTESKTAIVGCVLAMLAHSIISSGLFFTAGFLYDKFKTRNVLYYSSLFNTSNYMYLYIFIFVLANMSFPFTISFIGEMFLYCGLLSVHFNLFVIMIFSLFFSGLFCFMLLYRLIYNNKTSNKEIITFTIRQDIYISPFSVNNLLYFTMSETIILTVLLIITILFFFLNDTFVNLISQYLLFNYS